MLPTRRPGLFLLELHRLVFQPPVNFQNTFTTSFSGRLYDWKQQEKQAIQVIFDDKASPIYILVKASLSLPVSTKVQATKT
jgi:hypothetical protein